MYGELREAATLFADGSSWIDDPDDAACLHQQVCLSQADLARRSRYRYTRARRRPAVGSWRFCIDLLMQVMRLVERSKGARLQVRA